MKVWRCGKDFVVERDRSFESGAIIERFEPSEWAIEDENGSIRFEVSNHELCEITQRGPFDWYGSPNRTESRTVAEDLVLDTDPETARFIATVVGDERVRREEERLRRERAGEARITSIAGARSDYKLGEHFSRAQHALCEHIRNDGDALHMALLRTLVSLARGKANKDAISSFVRACLLACFAHQIPTFVATNTASAAPTLAAELLARAVELEQRAEGQDEVDARNNARQYRLAAEAARHAARSLA